MIFRQYQHALGKNYSLDWDHIFTKDGVYDWHMVLLKDDPNTHPDYKFLNVFVTFQ